MGTMQRKDLPPHAALKQALKDLDGQECRVGWFEGAKYEDGTPVAYVASIQEFGHGPIPPRSFMRSTQVEQSEQWAKLVEAAARGIASGRRTTADVFELLGAQVAGDVRAKIASIQEPPLSPLTIQARAHRAAGGTVTGKTLGELSRKGPQQTGGISTKPLVDTRIMLNTLTHQVQKK